MAGADDCTMGYGAGADIILGRYDSGSGLRCDLSLAPYGVGTWHRSVRYNVDVNQPDQSFMVGIPWTHVCRWKREFETERTAVEVREDDTRRLPRSMRADYPA